MVGICRPMCFRIARLARRPQQCSPWQPSCCSAPRSSCLNPRRRSCPPVRSGGAHGERRSWQPLSGPYRRGLAWLSACAHAPRPTCADKCAHSKPVTGGMHSLLLCRVALHDVHRHNGSLERWGCFAGVCMRSKPCRTSLHKGAAVGARAPVQPPGS